MCPGRKPVKVLFPFALPWHNCSTLLVRQVNAVQDVVTCEVAFSFMGTWSEARETSFRSSLRARDVDGVVAITNDAAGKLRRIPKDARCSLTATPVYASSFSSLRALI